MQAVSTHSLLLTAWRTVPIWMVRNWKISIVATLVIVVPRFLLGPWRLIFPEIDFLLMTVAFAILVRSYVRSQNKLGQHGRRGNYFWSLLWRSWVVFLVPASAVSIFSIAWMINFSRNFDDVLFSFYVERGLAHFGFLALSILILSLFGIWLIATTSDTRIGVREAIRKSLTLRFSIPLGLTLAPAISWSVIVIAEAINLHFYSLGFESDVPQDLIGIYRYARIAVALLALFAQLLAMIQVAAVLDKAYRSLRESQKPVIANSAK